jgi:hypothetical protein
MDGYQRFGGIYCLHLQSFSLVSYDTMYSNRWLPRLRRNLLPTSSGSVNMEVVIP